MKIILSPSSRAILSALQKRAAARFGGVGQIVRSFAWKAPFFVAAAFAMMTVVGAFMTPMVALIASSGGPQGVALAMGRLAAKFGHPAVFSAQGFHAWVAFLALCAAFNLAQFVVQGSRALRARPQGQSLAAFIVGQSPLFFVPLRDPQLQAGASAMDAWSRGERRPFSVFAKGVAAGLRGFIGLWALGLACWALLAVVLLIAMPLYFLCCGIEAAKKSGSVIQALREEGQDEFARQERALLEREAQAAGGNVASAKKSSRRL